MFKLSLLGPFEADMDGKVIRKFGSYKAQALLTYLAVEARRVHQREARMTLFWLGLMHKSPWKALDLLCKKET